MSDFKRNAIAAVALGLFLQLVGCLNPRPEELPSANTSDNVPGVSVRESCDSNPLLAGCGLPESDVNGAPASAGDADEEYAPSSPAPEYAPEDLSGSDAGAGAGDNADAGSLGDATDAGVP